MTKPALAHGDRSMSRRELAPAPITRHASTRRHAGLRPNELLLREHHAQVTRGVLGLLHGVLDRLHRSRSHGLARGLGSEHLFLFRERVDALARGTCRLL